MNSQDAAKRKAAEAALPYVEPGEVLGVGTGSTVNHFIDLLVEHKLANDIAGAVSSSNATTERLKKAGIRVLDLNQTGTLSVYVDGADEANKHLQLIKGGGAALTREKIVAAASRKVVDSSGGAIGAMVSFGRGTSSPIFAAKRCRTCSSVRGVPLRL